MSYEIGSLLPRKQNQMCFARFRRVMVIALANHLIDELRDADDLLLLVEDGHAEHVERDEAGVLLEGRLPEPVGHVVQIQDLEKDDGVREIEFETTWFFRKESRITRV